MLCQQRLSVHEPFYVFTKGGSQLDGLLRARERRIDLVAGVRHRIGDPRFRPDFRSTVLSALRHQEAYSLGKNNFPSAVYQSAEVSTGSVPFKNNSLIVPLVDPAGSRPVSMQMSRRTRRPSSRGGSRGASCRSSSRIVAAHSGVADRTANVSRIGRPSKFPAHTATVCCLLNPTVQASRNPLLVPVLTAMRCSNASGEWMPKLFSRARLSHKISVTISVAFRRSDRFDREMFRHDQLRAHRHSFAGEAGVSTGKIDQPNLSIAQNEPGAVIV